MKNTYEMQILNICIQTYYNLNGIMPGISELIEMLGGDFNQIISVNGLPADI